MELNQETWKFINTFAPWLSAIGTLSAVILSLHLARRDRIIRLEVSASHRLLVTPGQSNKPEYLFINIVNIGHRDAQITNIGWKSGILKKRHAILTTSNDGISSPLPIRLKDGEEARYMIPLNDQTNWLKDFGEEMLKPFPQVLSYFLKVTVYTSVGKRFEARIEDGLRKKLLEAIKPKKENLKEKENPPR